MRPFSFLDALAELLASVRIERGTYFGVIRVKQWGRFFLSRGSVVLSFPDLVWLSMASLLGVGMCLAMDAVPELWRWFRQRTQRPRDRPVNLPR